MKYHGIELTGSFICEKLAILPSWTADDEGRIAYLLSDEKLYLGDSTAWIEVGSGGESSTPIEVYTVATEVAQLALSNINQGDICLRSDESLTYVNTTGSNSTMSDWTALLSKDIIRAYSVVVAKSGGEYDVIQDAIDSITVGAGENYIVEIAPGTYEEKITLKSGVSLKGLGGVGEAIISATTGDLITVPGVIPYSVSTIEHLTLKCNPSAINSARAVVASGHYTRFRDIVFDVDIDDGYMDDIVLSSGMTVFDSCLFQHNSTGTSAGDTTIIKVTGDASFNIDAGYALIDVAEISSSLHFRFIEDDSTNTDRHDVYGLKAQIDFSGASFDGHVDFWNLNEATSAEGKVQACHVHIETPSGASNSEASLVHVSAGELSSSQSSFRIAGFEKNYTAEVDAGCVFSSHFDDINAVDGIIGDGTYNFVNSPDDGDLQISGAYRNMYDAVKTVGSRGCDYTTIQSALDDNQASEDEYIMFLVQPGTYANDTINFKNDNQTVQGTSSNPNDVIITHTTQVSDYGAYTGCKVSRVRIDCASSTLISVITGSGECIYEDCNVYLVQSTSQKYSAVYSGAGNLTILRGIAHYTNKNYISGWYFPIVIAPISGSDYIIDGVKITLDMTGAGNGCNLQAGIMGRDASQFVCNRCTIQVDVDTALFTFGIGVQAGSSVSYMGFNDITVNGSSNVGTAAMGIYASSDGSQLTLNSRYSNYTITGFNAYPFHIANATSKINSAFDVFDAANESSVTDGELNYIASLSDGDLDLSGDIISTSLLDQAMIIALTIY